MDDSIGYLILGILIIGFTFGLALQIQQVLRMRKENKPLQNRVRYVLYVRCVAYIGFLTAYILNVLIAAGNVPNAYVTDRNTSLWSFLFLIVLLLTYFVVRPNKSMRMQKEKL